MKVARSALHLPLALWERAGVREAAMASSASHGLGWRWSPWPLVRSRKRLVPSAEEGQPVLVVEEPGRPVVAVLHDVKRQTADVDARAAGPARGIAEIEPGPYLRASPRTTPGGGAALQM